MYETLIFTISTGAGFLQITSIKSRDSSDSIHCFCDFSNLAIKWPNFSKISVPNFTCLSFGDPKNWPNHTAVHHPRFPWSRASPRQLTHRSNCWPRCALAFSRHGLTGHGRCFVRPGTVDGLPFWVPINKCLVSDVPVVSIQQFH